jgi:hypothetical protein
VPWRLKPAASEERTRNPPQAGLPRICPKSIESFLPAPKARGLFVCNRGTTRRVAVHTLVVWAALLCTGEVRRG